MHIIKPLTKENITFVCDLMSEEGNVTALHTDIISLEEWQNVFVQTENDTDEENFVIYSNDIPCAWLKLNGLQNKDTAWISMLVVSDKFKHQGIGKFAVDFSVDYLTRRGFKQIKLHTTIDNVAAIKLYKKCGFMITETKSNKLTMCKEV